MSYHPAAGVGAIPSPTLERSRITPLMRGFVRLIDQCLSSDIQHHSLRNAARFHLVGSLCGMIAAGVLLIQAVLYQADPGLLTAVLPCAGFLFFLALSTATVRSTAQTVNWLMRLGVCSLLLAVSIGALFAGGVLAPTTPWLAAGASVVSLTLQRTEQALALGGIGAVLLFAIGCSYYGDRPVWFSERNQLAMLSVSALACCLFQCVVHLVQASIGKAMVSLDRAFGHAFVATGTYGAVSDKLDMLETWMLECQKAQSTVVLLELDPGSSIGEPIDYDLAQISAKIRATAPHAGIWSGDHDRVYVLLTEPDVTPTNIQDVVGAMTLPSDNFLTLQVAERHEGTANCLAALRALAQPSQAKRAVESVNP